MKKLLYLVLALTLALAACGTAPSPDEPADGPGAAGERLRARVFDTDADTLLLAGLEAPYDEVYAVPAEALPAVGVPPEELRTGAMVELTFDGSVEETFPARLGEITWATVPDDGYDGLCRLYLDVLEDLWSVDPALHADIARLGFDLGSTRLTPSEQAALGLVFARTHGIGETVFGTWQELAEQGLIDGENLCWDDGALLSVREKNDEYGQVLFDAEIWRSGLGAYLFCDCGSQKLLGGDWEPYTVGSEAVA